MLLMATRKSNAATRRGLAFQEIENVAGMMLIDPHTLKTSVEVILAETRKARKGA